MAVTINGDTGITSAGGYTQDGIVLADGTPSNTLVTTTSGNVGIGIATPAVKLQVVQSTDGEIGRYQRTGGTNIPILRFNLTESPSVAEIEHTGAAAGSLAFKTNGSERVRIDTSGNLLVGTTSAALSGYTGVAASGGAGIGTPLNASRNDVAANASAGCITVYTNFSTTQEKFIVRANGDVQNRTGSYTAYSDERLKENIVDARSYTEDLCKLRVVNYQFKADTIKTKYLGFVAQEVEQVIPGLVFETETDGLKDCKGVKLSIMIPMLVKAIQEQQALITQLQADVAALKEVK
jgi:hypothetical protein